MESSKDLQSPTRSRVSWDDLYPFRTLPFFFLYFFALSLFPSRADSAARAKIREICSDRIVLLGNPKISFNKVEKTFLCGDPKIYAWSHIPLNQAKFHLTTFLQERGYHRPTFTEREEKLI